MILKLLILFRIPVTEIMKIALCVAFYLVSTNGFVPQAQRPHVAFKRSATTTSSDLLEPTNLALSTLFLLCSTAVWRKEEQQTLQPSLAWMPRSSSSSTSSNDGIVSAMAMLNQAKLELSELSTTNHEISSSSEYEWNNDDTPIKSRVEQWERSVFDAMEQMEFKMEQSAQSTGKRSLQLIRTAVEPLTQLHIAFPWSARRSPLLELQKFETLERAVFDEMERLGQFMEQSASNTGADALKLVQTALESIHNLENQPQVRRAKIMYTQKLANIVRDMADRLESQAEQEKLAVEVDYEEVLITSVYRTRVRPTHRRRSGIISSFLTRLARKVSSKWHRV